MKNNFILNNAMTENKGIQIIITAVMASYEEHCEEE
jgi:hypothetical protein